MIRNDKKLALVDLVLDPYTSCNLFHLILNCYYFKQYNKIDKLRSESTYNFLRTCLFFFIILQLHQQILAVHFPTLNSSLCGPLFLPCTSDTSDENPTSTCFVSGRYDVFVRSHWSVFGRAVLPFWCFFFIKVGPTVFRYCL